MVYLNSRHGFQLRSINNVIKSLFQPRETDVNIPDKVVNAHKMYGDEYYRNVYLTKQMFEGVAFVAKYEKISKKQAAHLLIEAGFKYYIIEKIKQDARARIKARELNQKVKITRFVLLFQKFCQEAGINMTTDWNIKEEK